MVDRSDARRGGAGIRGDLDVEAREERRRLECAESRDLPAHQPSPTAGGLDELALDLQARLQVDPQARGLRLELGLGLRQRLQRGRVPAAQERAVEAHDLEVAGGAGACFQQLRMLVPRPKGDRLGCIGRLRASAPPSLDVPRRSPGGLDGTLQAQGGRVHASPVGADGREQGDEHGSHLVGMERPRTTRDADARCRESSALGAAGLRRGACKARIV